MRGTGGAASGCIKLDSRSRLECDLKPPKKMKKRRQLDALVNGNSRRKSKGQHELLRDTESSDLEEFSIPPKSIIRK